MRLTQLLTAGATVLVWSTLAEAADYQMTMLNIGPHGTFEFQPTLLRLQPGDRVHFVAKDKGHNVQSIPGMIPPGAEPFKSGINKDLTVTFSKPGVYGVECLPHYAMGMVGMIVVGDPSPNLSQAKKVTMPAEAKRVFAALFDDVERHQNANGLPNKIPLGSRPTDRTRSERN